MIGNPLQVLMAVVAESQFVLFTHLACSVIPVSTGGVSQHSEIRAAVCN
jgi:hypothetical protein